MLCMLGLVLAHSFILALLARFGTLFSVGTEQVKKLGIQNILALRGDPPKGEGSFKTVEGGFSCALDLVKYIR